MSNNAYELYKKSFEVARKLEKEIRTQYENEGYKVYTCFISYNQNSDDYFCDIEVGGDKKKYHRNYGNFTLKEICKAYKITIE